jgi:transcriptional regulator GlxA family with amidase domain
MDEFMAKIDSKDANFGMSGRPMRIGVLPIPGFALLSYASTVEPLRAANLLSRRVLYDVVNISAGAPMVQSSGAASVSAQARVGDMLNLDYLFVVAGGNPEAFSDRPVLNWLARQARFGVRIGGVSGGPVILVNAGLMSGRRMTVHWEHAAALAELSPALLVERSLYVIDRDRVTCAGGTAAMDLMHALIAQHHGAMFARSVSDWFLHTDIRPSIGPQRSGLVERIGTTNQVVLDAIGAMETRVADLMSLDQLAAVTGVSPRQLNRLFQQNLGRTPMQFYREMRLDMARNLLRNSSLSLTEIGLATGFASSSHFSRAYSARFGGPPSSLR